MIGPGSFVFVIQTERRYRPRHQWFTQERRIAGRVQAIDGDSAQVLHYDRVHSLLSKELLDERGFPMAKVVRSYPVSSLEEREPGMDDPLEFIGEDEKLGFGWEEDRLA